MEKKITNFGIKYEKFCTISAMKSYVLIIDELLNHYEDLKDNQRLHDLKKIYVLEFTKDETPEAINSLVKLANRLDEQEAAYALCHAKKAGLFTFAALPYVRTEDFTDTALETSCLILI